MTLIEAALLWRREWPDMKDELEMESGCDCEVCNLMRACDEHEKETGR